MNNVIQFPPKHTPPPASKHRTIGEICDELDMYGMEVAQIDSIIKRCKSGETGIALPDACLDLIRCIQDNANRPGANPLDFIRELNVLYYVIDNGLRK